MHGPLYGGRFGNAPICRRWGDHALPGGSWCSRSVRAIQRVGAGGHLSGPGVAAGTRAHSGA
eukprot:1363958-Pyramimonas_sp.AAC.1